MNNIYTVKQMTSWLSSYFQEQGYQTEIYSDKFLPARVPVYARKVIGEDEDKTIKEIIVDVINSQSIKSTDFFYDLKVSRTLVKGGIELIDAASATFFQYYFPRAKVYWSYPGYVKENDEFKKFKKLCQSYSIGLFRVDESNVEEIVSPIPLIDKEFENFKEAIFPIQEYLESKYKLRDTEKIIHEVQNNLYERLDLHIEETNKYLIYYPEPEYKRREIIGRHEGRNISLTLIDKMAEVEHLRYKTDLQRLAADYRTRIEDDYEIALNLIKELWHNIGLEYPEFQKDFEPVLLLNPRYRDHFLHQLHVFLLGCYIIDKLHEEEPFKDFNKKYKNSIEDMWLLASTYHDYNYNIQNYNDWIATFFQNTLFLDKNPSSLKLEECYVKEDYMFKTKELCDAFENLTIDRTTLLFFYEKIIDDKNHGLLGALSLLKLFDKKHTTGIHRKALLQAARAIALHDEDIWQHFSGRSESDFSQKHFLETLHFEKDPLSFLLIFCDTIQEWGRVGRFYEKTGARLDDIGISNNIVWVNISVRNEEAFNYKKDEIDRVKKFLCDERFKIKLKSRNVRGSIEVERYMEGK